MIRIEHVRLPGGLQAFARLEDGTVVVYVSADLSVAERTTAIARALRAAPEAGWREPHRPVLLPALAGGARLRLVPESRWAYRGLAAVPAALAAAVVALALLGGSAPASPVTAAPSMPPVTAPASGPAGAPGTAQRKGPGLRSGSAASSGPSAKGHGKTSGHGGGGAPAPQGSGRPSPTPTATQPGSPKPSPDPKPSPSPSPSSCVSVLGVTVCL